MDHLEFEHILINHEGVLEKARCFLERKAQETADSQEEAVICENLIIELHHCLGELETLHGVYEQSLKTMGEHKNGFASYAVSQGLMDVNANGDLADVK